MPRHSTSRTGSAEDDAARSGTDERRRFHGLRARAFEQMAEGRYTEALSTFDEALSTARRGGDQNLVDLAVCNRSAVALELGEGEDLVPELRQILVRNADPDNCWLAAYTIARHYELIKNYKKGLFYARLARDRAMTLDRSDWRASSFNQIGNLLLAESYVEESTAAYESALALIPEERALWRAYILDNLGYCRILQARHEEGFTLLYRSLRTLRRLGTEREQLPPHLDLCFAHLEVGRYRWALKHGEAALDLALRLGDRDASKNALYLLGETAALLGEEDAAAACFHRLQEEHYPDQPHIARFLLSVDVRKMINLKA